MSVDISPNGTAEVAIIEAIKNGLLTVYAEKGPHPDEMEKLARAITPGIMTALQLLNGDSESNFAPSSEHA
jgi:hypothetical protein